MFARSRTRLVGRRRKNISRQQRRELFHEPSPDLRSQRSFVSKEWPFHPVYRSRFALKQNTHDDTQPAYTPKKNEEKKKQGRFATKKPHVCLPAERGGRSCARAGDPRCVKPIRTNCRPKRKQIPSHQQQGGKPVVLVLVPQYFSCFFGLKKRECFPSFHRALFLCSRPWVLAGWTKKHSYIRRTAVQASYIVYTNEL